jgi:hypothetical protein
MKNSSLIFTGTNYSVWDFVLSHICGLFLHNYERNQMLRFSGVGYWECQSYFNGNISIRTSTNADVNILIQRRISIKENELLILEHNNHDYFIQCQELRFINLGIERPTKSDNFVFNNEDWERLWLDGKILKQQLE